MRYAFALCLCLMASPALSQEAAELPPPPSAVSSGAEGATTPASTQPAAAVYRCQGGVCQWSQAATTSTARVALFRGRLVERSVLVSRRVLAAPRRVFARQPVRRLFQSRPLRGLLCRRGGCG